MAESRGNYHQDHKLMPDSTVGYRHSDQHPTTEHTTPRASQHTEGRGSEQSATEEVANEDDDEDSSTAHDDEQDEEEEPEVSAPSHGFGMGGKGKGKRPSIRVEPAGSCDEPHNEEDETVSHEPGPIPFKHPVNQLLMKNKKRTFSNLSSTSILFGDDSTDQESFPRRKAPRILNGLTSVPLPIYQDNYNEMDVENDENAIESDDDDYSGVNLIPEDDDDSDMEMMEQQEENYILQDEQQATTLLNEYHDARRLSLDSCASDNIFGVTVPLGQTFVPNLADFGFGQYFEPEALPASPNPTTKRKYSDSSTKRVRFDDEVQVSDSSSSESSELDSNVFPDLFLAQDKLPPVLNQLLEMENDEDDGDMASPMSDGSFWDFGHDEPRIAAVEHSDDTDNDSTTDSSGYDCTLMPYNVFDSITNVRCQLTWVIQLMRKISAPMSLHGHRFRSNLSCADHLQQQAPGPIRLSRFKEALDRLAVKYLPFGVFSYTMTALRLSQSRIGQQRLSLSTVPAHQ